MKGMTKVSIETVDGLRNKVKERMNVLSERTDEVEREKKSQGCEERRRRRRGGRGRRSCIGCLLFTECNTEGKCV